LRAVLLREIGGRPELADLPEPAEVPPRTALLRIEAAGLCYRDHLVTIGKFPRARAPLVLGHEFSGRVVRVGEGVEGLKEGELVTGLPHTICNSCEFCLTARENLCVNKKWYGEEAQGVFAEYALVDASTLVRVPDGVSPSGAAISSCVVGMLINAMREVGRARAGEVVVVTGAGGGVGIHAVQVAKALGCRVIGVTRTEEKAEAVRRAGADFVVVGSSFAEEVRRTHGGADLVLEAVGEPTMAESIRSLKWGGRLVLVGNVTAGTFPLPLGLVILKGLSVLGSVGSTVRTMREALEMMARGTVKPVVREVRLEDYEAAFSSLREGRALGRFVFRPAT
jgi:acryloyl-coenzyme A reductase